MQHELMAARRQLDYQESLIGFELRLDPETGFWEFPFYPPTDATRNDPRQFDRWRQTMAWRKALQQRKDTGELRALERGWQVGERVLRELRLGGMKPEVWAYRWWDGDLGRDVACDHGGRMATSFTP